jgi:hypothetical protein
MLVFERRHVSPSSLGAVLLTEFYACPACDARFTYTPSTDHWRQLPGAD